MGELAIVLALLYLIEGLGWISLGAQVLSRRPWGGFSVRSPKQLRSTIRRGLVLPEPWAPALERFYVHAWPVALAPEGVASLQEDTVQPRLFWEEAEALQVAGTRLVLGSRWSVETGSPRAARELRYVIRQVAATPEAERDAAIQKAIAANFDIRCARRRLRRVDCVLRAQVRGTAWVMTANLLLGPIPAMFLGIATVWPIWAALHVLMLTNAAVVFAEVKRRLPDLVVGSRVETLVMMVLYPPAAARFVQPLFSHAFAGLDPLCVDAVLFDTEHLAASARQRFMQLHPTSDDCEIRSWFGAAVRHEIEVLLRTQGISREVLLAPPPQEPDAFRYCPRCGTQYREALPHCVDCQGVALIEYEDVLRAVD